MNDELVAFCEREHPRLVGAVGLFCGDVDLAEDVAQETLARVCRDWEKVARLDRPEAWAMRVAFNLVRSHFRRRKTARKAAARLSVREWHEDSPSDGELLRELRKLPERQRQAIILRYYFDLPIREIGDAMDCPEGTVKTLVHKGLRNLRRNPLVTEVINVG